MKRLLATVLLAATAGCTPTVDLLQTVTLTDVKTGWFDAGILETGQNKLVPSISLRVQNKAGEPVARVQLNAIFHRVTEPADGWGEHYVSAVDADGLASGSSTESLVLRSTLGYTGDQSRLDMLNNSSFVDATVTVFGKQGRGNWVKLGEYPLTGSYSGSSASGHPAAPVLERRLNRYDAAAIIVSNVIGGGILFTAPQIAAAVPSGPLFLSTWLVGGLLAFAGAMAYAELASLRPRAGGEYVYLREAYGPLLGFLTGWTSFVAGFSGATAASAMVLAFYLGRFVPAAGDPTPFFTLPIAPGFLSLTLSPQTIVALAAIWGLAWVHIGGVGPGRFVGNLLATLKITAFIFFIAAGFALGAGDSSNVAASAPVSGAGWLLALIPVMFTYSGWNAAAYVAEEIRDPGKNVPRALALGTAAVIVIYLAMNTLYLYVLPVGELAAIRGSVLDVIADRLLGSAAGNVMGVVSIVSLLASISAMTFAGPRVYFAMARDGLFFRRAANVHHRFRTPAIAIAAQAAWSSVLVLSASADALVNYTGFAIVLFSGLAVLAVFVLRAKQPDAPRPFRAWGYPIAPAIYVLASAAILLNGLYQAPGPTGTGALVILAGVPLFLLFRTRRSPA